jgi:pimeloyl-ACP methyl ester carboxylesterase
MTAKMKANCKYLILLAASILLLNGLDAAGEWSRRRDLVRALYDKHERECLKKGWKQVLVNVKGIERKILWKGPSQKWTFGAIIALHGGGGTYSNFGSNIPLGAPMVEFGNLAVNEGFAFFSIESTWGLVTDSGGRDCGKRWDCIAQEGKENIDLPFIGAVLTDIIPKLRPSGSAGDIFMTGISNGGFMTVLASTSFPDKITAFAAVSSGDPYGTYMDMGTHPPRERVSAPGVFRDNETNTDISQKGAAYARTYPREKKWPEMRNVNVPLFRQFHHRGDGACDISCMEKARLMLVRHGYKDHGPFIIEDSSGRSVLNHFWNVLYNRPILEFFKTGARKGIKNGN